MPYAPDFEPSPADITPDKFILTGMETGAMASVTDAIYYPIDNRIELVLEAAPGAANELYTLEAELSDRTGEKKWIFADNCGIALEKNAEFNNMSIVRVQYVKDGIPLCGIGGEENITALVKIVNGTDRRLERVQAVAAVKQGSDILEFFSQPVDIEAESCIIAEVDITGIVIENSGNISISLE